MKKLIYTGVTILVSTCILLLIINIASGGAVTYFWKSVIFSQKANEDRVSKSFSMEISHVNHDGRDYIFYGTDLKTRDEKYIILPFIDGQYHEVLASEGITLNEATELAIEEGYEVNCSILLLMDSYRNDVGGDILEHLDWMVYHDPRKGSLRVDFLTGKIKDELNEESTSRDERGNEYENLCNEIERLIDEIEDLEEENASLIEVNERQKNQIAKDDNKVYFGGLLYEQRLDNESVRFVPERTELLALPHEGAPDISIIQENTLVTVYDKVSVQNDLEKGALWYYVQVPVYDTPMDYKGWIRVDVTLDYNEKTRDLLQSDVYILGGSRVVESFDFPDMETNQGYILEHEMRGRLEERKDGYIRLSCPGGMSCWVKEDDIRYPDFQ